MAKKGMKKGSKCIKHGRGKRGKKVCRDYQSKR